MNTNLPPVASADLPTEDDLAAADYETGWASRSWLSLHADSIEQEAASGA